MFRTRLMQNTRHLSNSIKLYKTNIRPAQQHLKHNTNTSILLQTTRRSSTMAPSLEEKPEDTGDALPKLTPSEHRQYNHMADHMDQFHNHFRHDWNQMYAATTSGKRPMGMSIRAFLQHIDQFCSQLTTHHTIEERYIFPVLAKKMPAFREELELLTHHKLIHEGIEKLEKYTDDCRTGETEFRMSELKNIMDSFGSTLWEHLDAEVSQLGAENMRKYWTLEEMKRMPM